MIKEKIKSFYEKVLRNSKRTLAVAGLAGLVLTTCIKDNVHMGSVTLNNPKGNHYAWGILPKITINGRAEGSFYSMGLISGVNEYGSNAVHNGNSVGVGLINSINEYGLNAVHKGNSVGVGLIGSINEYGSNAVHKGNSVGVGLIGSINEYGSNAVHNGNSRVIGIILFDEEGFNLFANKIIRENSTTNSNLKTKSTPQ
jgi:hypothetical protein